jgi:hypothetical protein
MSIFNWWGSGINYGGVLAIVQVVGVGRWLVRMNRMASSVWLLATIDGDGSLTEYRAVGFCSECGTVL